MDNTGRWGWEDPPTPTALAEGGEGGYSLFPRPGPPPTAPGCCSALPLSATADRSRQSGAGSCMSTSEPRTPDPRSPVSPVGMGMGMGVGMGILHCGLRGGLGGPLQGPLLYSSPQWRAGSFGVGVSGCTSAACAEPRPGSPVSPVNSIRIWGLLPTAYLH